MRIFTTCLALFILSYAAANTSVVFQDLKKYSYDELDSITGHLFNIGSYKSAIIYAQAGREKAKNELGTLDTTYAKFTNHLTILYKELGSYKQSISLCQETLNIYSRIVGKNHPIYASCIDDLASLYKRTGKYEKAEALYHQAMNIFSKTIGKEHPNYAMSLNNLANLYGKMGIYEQAKTFYLEALEIYTKTIGTDHPNYAASLQNLALVYKATENYKAATQLYSKVLKIIEKPLGKLHPNYAVVLHNLANLYETTNNFGKAEVLYLEALEIVEVSLGKTHKNFGRMMNRLASLYQKMGKYKQAEILYQNALSIKAIVVGKEHPSYAITLNQLASLYKKMHHDELSWNYALQAIEALTKLNSPKIDSTWINQLKYISYPSNVHIVEIVNALTCIYNLLGQKYNSPVNITQTMIVDLVIHLLKNNRDTYISEKDKLRLLAESHNWMMKGLNSLDLNTSFDKAFANVEFHKSILLLEATKAEKAMQNSLLPDSLALKVKKLHKKQAELEAALFNRSLSPKRDSILTPLNEINLQISILNKYIKKNYPLYNKINSHNRAININAIQQTLEKDQALIEYVLGDSSVYAFYIDKNHTKALKLHIQSDSLTYQIDNLHHTISNYFLFRYKIKEQYHLYSEVALWFYQQLLMPLLTQAKHIKHLIIIPDGKLAHLPFEVFLTKKAPVSLNYKNLSYLIRDFQVSYQYSAALWIENKKINPYTSNNNGQILAMSAKYDTSLSSSNFRLPAQQRLRSKLRELPAAKLEVDALANEFKGYFGYDSLATERNFKNLAKNYKIIHLALHGLLDEKFPMLSSLAFSESIDSTENNFLQAYEISNMELHADLVVLSACQTGYGKFEQGNGIASLARSFMYAGVPSLVVSLWQVDDKATSIIMKNFYTHLAYGSNQAEALRKAKLEYINQVNDHAWAHPAYWSPFIQIGNSKPIQIQRKMAYTPWYVAIVSLLLVAGLVFWNRKRIF